MMILQCLVPVIANRQMDNGKNMNQPLKSLQCLVVYTFLLAMVVMSLIVTLIPFAVTGEGGGTLACVAPLLALTAWAAIKSYREVYGKLSAI